MRIAKCDIETPFIGDDGNILAIKKIFCIGIQINNEPVKRFTYIWVPWADGNLRAALQLLNSVDRVVFHNGIKFDVPVITNLLGNLTVPVHDTLILAKLMFTSEELWKMDIGIPTMPKKLYGSYSLKAFGFRLGIYKEEFSDFAEFSEEMVDYMEQDVIVTTALYDTLLGMDNFPSDEVVQLENDVACITFQQERNGFYFDIDTARQLLIKYKFQQSSIERRLQKQFRPMFLPEGQPKSNNSVIRRKLYIPAEKEMKW